LNNALASLIFKNRDCVRVPVVKRSRWQIVKVFEDAGISGSKGRDKRPGLDAMLKAVNARSLICSASCSTCTTRRSICFYINRV